MILQLELSHNIMKKRNELMERIESLNTPEIKIETYGGFSYLHVDLNYNNKPVLWCAISCGEEIDETQALELKISDINDIVFHYDDKAEAIVKKLIEICKEINVTRIYGRIAVIKDFKEIEKFYTDLGFTIIHTPNEKNYDSAKINLVL